MRQDARRTSSGRNQVLGVVVGVQVVEAKLSATATGKAAVMEAEAEAEAAMASKAVPAPSSPTALQCSRRSAGLGD